MYTGTIPLTVILGNHEVLALWVTKKDQVITKETYAASLWPTLHDFFCALNRTQEPERVIIPDDSHGGIERVIGGGWLGGGPISECGYLCFY